jgi:hypothetical protein
VLGGGSSLDLAGAKQPARFENIRNIVIKVLDSILTP